MRIHLRLFLLLLWVGKAASMPPRNSSSKALTINNSNQPSIQLTNFNSTLSPMDCEDEKTGLEDEDFLFFMFLALLLALTPPPSSRTR